MKQIRSIFAAILAVASLSACDEGDIREADDIVTASGKTAVLTASISGAGSWGSQYSLVLAAFAEGSGNAVIQKQVALDSPTELKLTSDDIATVELCITNRLRERIVSFASVAVSTVAGDTVRLDAGEVDADMFGCLQSMLFTPTCARCHGLGTTPAAGLTLVEGQSYAQLVGHPSSNPDRAVRVVPGDAAGSLLHKVLHGDDDAGVHFDNKNMVKESNTLTLIDNWINNLDNE